MSWTTKKPDSFFEGLKTRATYRTDNTVPQGGTVIADGVSYTRSSGLFNDNIGTLNVFKGEHVTLFDHDKKTQLLAYPSSLKGKGGPSKPTVKERAPNVSMASYRQSKNSFTGFLVESGIGKKFNLTSSGEGFTSLAVRRPLLGVMPKANTYASLYITSERGTNPKPTGTPFKDSLTGKNQRISFNFLVNNMSQQHAENSQMLLTFGKTYFLFFGERPTTIQVSGYLLNSRDFNWKYDFLQSYKENLRGTKVASGGYEVVFAIDETLYSGYIMDLSLSDDSEVRELCQFSFSMVVTRFSVIQDANVFKAPAEKKKIKGGEGKTSRTDYEYAGTWAPTNKDGKMKETTYSIEVFTPFHRALSNLIGLDVRNIQRLEQLLLVGTNNKGLAGLSQFKLSGGQMFALGTSIVQKQTGSHVFELDKLLG